MRFRAFLAGLLAAGAFGCGAADVFDGDEDVPIDQVPAPVMTAAGKALPGVKFTRAWKAKIDGQDAYEVQGKTKEGKTREAEVSVSGKVLNIE